jgi:hypothetical protein
VTGARYVNLAWLEPGGWVQGSVWAFSDPDLVARVLTQARYAVPGFDPMTVRFASDVNAAVKRVFVERRAHFAPFSEHAEGTVNPLLTTLVSRMLRLEWTHSVPLLVAGEVAGALAFHWAERPHPRALSVAEAFSAQVALTVENARLGDALRARADEIASSSERIAVAAEETRREIARTLDRVGSRILVATQRLLGCRALLASSPEYAATELGQVAEELDRLREVEVRAASHRLHPSLIEVGLVPALEVLADSFGEDDVRVSTLPGVTALDGIARNALPGAVRLAMYRSIEEALGAVAALGQARGARVEISIERGALRGEVAYARAGGQGALGDEALRAIRDRVERVDGTVEFEAGEREARLAVLVPLPEAARRAAAGAPGSDLFQRISENALGVTGARMVTLSWYEPAEEALVFGALAPLGALGPLLAAARRIVPGFDLAKMRFRSDLNPLVRAVFIEGRAMLARPQSTPWAPSIRPSSAPGWVSWDSTGHIRCRCWWRAASPAPSPSTSPTGRATRSSRWRTCSPHRPRSPWRTTSSARPCASAPRSSPARAHAWPPRKSASGATSPNRSTGACSRACSSSRTVCSRRAPWWPPTSRAPAPSSRPSPPSSTGSAKPTSRAPSISCIPRS